MNVARLKRFWTYLSAHRRVVVLLFLSTLLSILVSLPTPWCEKIIIDQAIPGRDPHILLSMTGAIVGLLVTQRLLIYLRSYLSIRLKQRVLTQVRMLMYEHLQKMSLRFFARHPTGNLLSRLTNDVGYIQNLLSNELFEVVGMAIKVVIVVWLLFAISIKLTLLCGAILPLIAAIFLLFKKKVYQHSRALQETQARLSGRIQQNFSGMKLIQTEVIEEAVRDETLEASYDLERVAVKREMVATTGNLMTTLLSYGPLLCLLWGLGGYMVIEGTLTLGELLAFSQYLLGLINPATRFFQFSMNLQAGYAALDRIYEILDEPPEIQDRPDAQDLEPPLETITFEHVSLNFGEGSLENAALQDVSFEIRRGEKVALVGPSGAGKTSVLHLLLRFFEPTEGTLRMNGQPLSSYSLRSLRRQIAYACQEVFLFGRDVRHNVTLYRETPDESLEVALRLAVADEFVSGLDGGMDASLDELGANLSGGQRQRLALARVFLKETSLYLLDEATSALDTRSEKQVLENLRDFLKERTAIIIAHRFSFLEIVDRILVFSEGRLVEEGTLDELLRKRGLFYALYQTRRAGAPSKEGN